MFLILDCSGKPEYLKPFWLGERLGRPTCVFLRYPSVQKCTGKCASQSQQRQRENATLKRFNLDYYNSLWERSRAATVIITNRCVSGGVRVPDLIWSCHRGVLTPQIAMAKQQRVTRAEMFGLQIDEKHQKSSKIIMKIYLQVYLQIKSILLSDML